jgi:pseudaminic acid synthase
MVKNLKLQLRVAMTKKITIDGRDIGPKYPPYIIAEMSANHNGNIENAFEIIRQSKKMGADAVKLQTYTADTLTLDSKLPDFMIDDGLWAGRSLYELYQLAYTPWEWHKPLFDFARKIDITIFSSPFDKTAVDLLEDLNTPAYKIASFEAVDLELIKYVAYTKKPMIISTGMADCEEIKEAIDTAKSGGCNDVAILHCVSGYPAPSENYNLRTISDMIERFGLVTGLSDHTLDNTTAITSIAMGSSIIEKHFTIDRLGGGPDDSFSMEPADLARLVVSTETAYQSLGSVDYGLKSSELGNIKFRRSLYFIKPLKAGDLVTSDAIRCIRPGYGIAPKHLASIIGLKVKEDIKIGTAVTKNLFD